MTSKTFVMSVSKTVALSVVATLGLFLIPLAQTFDLSAEDSFAKFQKWNPCSNGSLEFEFKTDLVNALLLYTDDGQKEFITMRLISGYLELHMDFGVTLQSRTGSNLNDNVWHHVFLGLSGRDVLFGIDHNLQKLYLHGDQRFGNYSTNNGVYIGGLPKEFGDNMAALSRPAALFEPRFKGSIRNILFSDCGGPKFRAEWKDYMGIISSTDYCIGHNPCQHGGICLVQDAGVKCNCTYTEYEGDVCEKRRTPSEVTFMGSQYLMYDWAQVDKPITSNRDEVSLYFRTRQPSGNLFYTGQGSDYMTISLKNGGISVSVNLGSGAFHREVQPRGIRFDDNLWHHVLVTRQIREVNIVVDGVYEQHGSTAGDFLSLSSSLLYVGGTPNTPMLHAFRVKNNFKGCMKKVTYKADQNLLDVTRLVIDGSPLLRAEGEVVVGQCQDIVESQPVTFSTPESFIILPSWEVGSTGGTLSFNFQTNEANGVIIYNSGPKNTDFFAFEIVDKYLFLVIDLGSGAHRVKVSGIPANDGQLHQVSIEHIGRNGTVVYDGQRISYTVRGESFNLDIKGVLCVGGFSKDEDQHHMPKEILAGMLGYGYVGCMQDLIINGNRIDLLTAARVQQRRGITDHCHQMEPQCTTRPCLNDGVCVEGWNRYVCDCRTTSFVGSFCQTAAATLEFDSTQYMKITLDTETETYAEDISLRFRTTRLNGLLFITSSDRSQDFMALYMENGYIKLQIWVRNSDKVLTIGRGPQNDNMWHTVFIKRRERTVELSLDHNSPIIDSLPDTYLLVLYVKSILLGSPGPMLSDSMPGNDQDFRFQNIELGNMMQDDNLLRRFSGFVGSMQNFVFNGNHFIEMARANDIKNIEVTARFDTDEPLLKDPVTFKSKESYVELSTLNIYSAFSIYYKFKTTEPDGLIMYNGGYGDFLAFELQGGFLYYIYSTGSGPVRVGVNTVYKLNDNEWHDVRLQRATEKEQLIHVDDQPPTKDSTWNIQSQHFNLEGPLYLGGVQKNMYNSLPVKISSRNGFQGCMASLDLHGIRTNILDAARRTYSSVVKGCQVVEPTHDRIRPTAQCHDHACTNRGVCELQWNTHTCNCDMTSYAGPTCADNAVQCTFGVGGPGMFVYRIPVDKRPSTNRDQIAFGFSTLQRSGLLLRVEGDPPMDYIEVEMNNGNIIISYDMGTDRLPIGESLRTLNDGKYHVVRFTRSGSNATLQIDDDELIQKYPAGTQSHVFNNQSVVHIGGYHRAGGVERQFVGMLQGMTFNRVHLLTLAANNDARIKVVGQVKIKIPERNEGMQATMGAQWDTTPSHGTTEEIITEVFSGDDCLHDDEEFTDCSTGSGSDDDIIKPTILIHSTPKPPTTTMMPEEVLCDDEMDPECEGQSTDFSSAFPNDNVQTSDDLTKYPPSNPKDPIIPVAPQNTTTKTDNSVQKIGLIVGIVVVVLIALIILIVALYKFHKRDEGTYKVDETQNFAYMEAKKHNGNGVFIGPTPGQGKTCKKKDVKEWYV